MIGSLFQFFRQMDAAMTSDEAVAVYRDAFLRGDYGLEEINRKEPSKNNLHSFQPFFEPRRARRARRNPFVSFVLFVVKEGLLLVRRPLSATLAFPGYIDKAVLPFSGIFDT